MTVEVTSRLKGTYYIITDSEGVEEVNEEEMRGMLGAYIGLGCANQSTSDVSSSCASLTVRDMTVTTLSRPHH